MFDSNFSLAHYDQEWTAREWQLGLVWTKECWRVSKVGQKNMTWGHMKSADTFKKGITPENK